MKKKYFKKKSMVMLLLSLLTLIFMACNSTGNNKSDATDDSSKDQNATRTIQTAQGEVTVPANPSRVVVQYVVGDVLALGITPVGISDIYDGAAYKDLTSGIKSLGHFSKWDPESVMQLDPDVILVINEEDVAKFSKFAPTILIPYGEMSQEERVNFIGQVLNKENEAKALIDKYNTAVEAGKDRLKKAGFDNYTVSVFEGGLDNMTVLGDQFGTGGVAYNSLGIKSPEKVNTDIRDKGEYNASVSFEVLPQYAGDFIIRNSYEGMDDLTQSAVWNNIPAVKANHVINMEFGLSYYTDIYSAIAQVEFVSNALTEAAK